jgi:hypothetical protein
VRSWQRVLIIGACILVVGAVATVACANYSQGPLRNGVALAGVIGLGIGGSVIASALVTRLVANQVFGVDIGDAVEALRGASALTRSDQSLEITLKRIGEEVHISAQHRFNLLGSSKYIRRLPFSLYTDAARWGSGGGFYSIVEPDDTVLAGDALAQYLSEQEGKIQFNKMYTFHPGKTSHFEVETFGHFRRGDRLIWTVEHISSDFSVRILDRRGEGKASVKINHHRRSEITDDMKERPTQEGQVIDFTYLGEVLPFQGFELQWSAE